MPFGDMNYILIRRLEDMKSEDGQNNYGLRDIDIGDDLIINRSTRQVSSTHAQNKKIQNHVIEIQNLWMKFDRVTGIKTKLHMGE